MCLLMNLKKNKDGNMEGFREREREILKFQKIIHVSNIHFLR